MPIKAIVIQEAGLDGFWIHRLLLAEGIESHVVDAASIAVNRRHRRAKTDAIDGETLLRTLMAWARGERRVCSMVRAPSPEEEDRRRLTRERGTLLKERIQHTNRVRGLLSGQGIRDYNPCDRESSGEENEHEVLKPFIAIQRVQLPPGKGQIELDYLWRRTDCLVHSLHNSPREMIVDDFRNRSAAKSENRRSARHRFDHDESKWFGPIDWEEQRERLAEEFCFVAIVDLSDELYAWAAEQR